MTTSDWQTFLEYEKGEIYVPTSVQTKTTKIVHGKILTGIYAGKRKSNISLIDKLIADGHTRAEIITYFKKLFMSILKLKKKKQFFILIFPGLLCRRNLRGEYDEQSLQRIIDGCRGERTQGSIIFIFRKRKFMFIIQVRLYVESFDVHSARHVNGK